MVKSGTSENSALARRTPPRLAAVTLGLAVVALSLIGAGIPSPWTDEVATLEASRRSPEEMLHLFGYIDRVHGLYYLIVHAWSLAFGDSIVAVRAFSAAAAGVATAGVVVLGDRLGGRAVAWWSGIAFAVLPVVTMWGAEARSQAAVMAAVAWTTVAFVRAAGSQRGVDWLWYSLGVAFTGLLFVQTVLLVPAHLVTLVWRRESRPVWLRWGVAAAVPALALAPFAVAASQQTGQVSWVPRPELLRGAASILLNPWFAGSYLVTAAAGVWILLAVVRAVRTHEWLLPSLALPWVVVPSLVLLLYSHFATPMYQPRYLAHAAGAVALLIGSGLAAVGRRIWVAVAGVLVIAVGSALIVVPSRAPFAKEGSDWGQLSLEVQQQSRPGDAVSFVPDDGGPRSPRRALDAFPERFASLDDTGLAVVAREQGILWSSGQPLEATAKALAPSQRLWVLAATRKFPQASSDAIAELRSEGFAVDTVWVGPTSTLLLATRE